MREKLNAFLCAVVFAALGLGAESLQWDWRHAEALTSKQWLSHAKISSADRDAIAKALANLLLPDLGGPGGFSEQEVEQVALETPVKVIDLNGDGIPEIIAQGTPQDGGCSHTGNCRFWIFEKSGPEYRLLISVPAIQSFTIQPARSNGFNDVVVKTYGSSTQSTLRLLRYTGTKYEEAGCFNANWPASQGGTGHEANEPHLTPCAEK